MSISEIWRPIPGYENLYEASSSGQIRSVPQVYYTDYFQNGRKRGGKILRATPNPRSGYLSVVLTRGGEHHRLYVHRLVAEAFLPNPKHYSEVNHKDENKGNNHVENLEWCDRTYNIRYGTGRDRRYEAAKSGKKGRCYPKDIAQYSLDGELIAIYRSSQEAARAIGKPASGSNIRICARGERGVKQALGYVWKYLD